MPGILDAYLEALEDRRNGHEYGSYMHACAMHRHNAQRWMLSASREQRHSPYFSTCLFYHRMAMEKAEHARANAIGYASI